MEKKRMSWKDGWYEVDNHFSYFVENGMLVRGLRQNGIESRPLFPYLPNKSGGYDRVEIKANKRNYDRVIWR